VTGLVRVSFEYPPDAPLAHLLEAMPFLETHRLSAYAHGRRLEDLVSIRGGDPDGWRWFEGERCVWIEHRFPAGGEVAVFCTKPIAPVQDSP
jgi:hypothetical protein